MWLRNYCYICMPVAPAQPWYSTLISMLPWRFVRTRAMCMESVGESVHIFNA